MKMNWQELVKDDEWNPETASFTVVKLLNVEQPLALEICITSVLTKMVFNLKRREVIAIALSRASQWVVCWQQAVINGPVIKGPRCQPANIAILEPDRYFLSRYLAGISK